MRSGNRKAGENGDQYVFAGFIFFPNVSEQERREKRPRKSKQPVFPPFPASHGSAYFLL